MKTIDSVILLFENCESVTIFSEDILEFYISNIYTGIETVGSNIFELLKTDSFLIKIDKLANVEEDTLENNEKIFDRLKMYNDIKEIVIVYTDNTNKKIMVEWTPMFLEIDYLDYLSNDENKNQDFLMDNDNLVVYCGKSFDNNIKNKLLAIEVSNLNK